MTDLCTSADPAVCDDGLSCNGEERCDVDRGCVQGVDVVCGLWTTCSEPAGGCVCEAQRFGAGCAVTGGIFAPMGSVEAIEIEGSYLWLGTSHGLWLLDHQGTPSVLSDDRTVQFTATDGVPGEVVRAVKLDPRGGLWVVAGGLSYLDVNGTPFDKSDDVWTHYTDREGLSYGAMADLAIDPRGDKWFARNFRYKQPSYGGRIDDKGNPFDTSDDAVVTLEELGAHLLEPNAIVAGRNGEIWVSSGGWRFPEAFDPVRQKWEEFTEASTGLLGHHPSAVRLQGDNLVWMGLDIDDDGFVNTSAIAILDHGKTISEQADDRWITLDLSDEVQSIAVFALDEAGVAWLGDRDAGLYRLDVGPDVFDTTGDLFGVIDASLSGTSQILAIVPRSTSELWLGTLNGLRYLNHRGTADTSDDQRVDFPAPPGLPDEWVMEVAIDAAGDKWLTTSSGAAYLHDAGTPLAPEDDSWVHFGAGEMMGSLALTHIAISPSGAKYFVSAPRGVWTDLNVLHDNHTPLNKSDDTWLHYQNARYLSAFALAIDARDQVIVLSGSNEFRCLDDAGTPLFQPDDTWTELTNLDFLGDVVAISAARGGFWVGTTAGLFYWNDGGSSCDTSDDTITSLGPNDTLTSGIHLLSPDEAGGVWVGFQQATSLGYFHPGEVLDDGADDRWAHFGVEPHIGEDPSFGLNLLEAGARGKVWFQGRYKLGWLDTMGSPFDPTDDVYATTSLLDPPWRVSQVHDLSSDPSGGVWLATASQGLVYVQLEGSP